MYQIEPKKMEQLYPFKTNRIFFLNHSLNEEDCIGRMLESVYKLTNKIVVLIDDRTVDNTEKIAKSYGALTSKFSWRHSYSYAKNKSLSVAMDKYGLKYGDWVLFMGADFELQDHTIPEIKKFISNPYNFFAQFWVPEYTPNKNEKVVTRKRKLLWRHHPMIYWERSVHEEAVFSAYRLTGMGIPFGDVEWKEFPILGGDNGMMHYGFYEDGGENGDVFWRKKAYYLILLQIDRVRMRYNLPETPEGTLQALGYIYNAPQKDLNKSIEELLERYMAGDIPKGLIEYSFATWSTINDKDYSP